MKYVINVVAIIVLIIVVILTVNIKNNSSSYPFQYEIGKFFKEISKIIQTKQHNIKMEVSPTRKKRTTYIDKEENLRQFLPQVFAKFSDSDWKKFWALMYEPVYDKKSEYGKKRYLTQEEVSIILLDKFPEFGHFNSEHWSYFWSIVGVNFEEKSSR